jgi:hypothetical protein
MKPKLQGTVHGEQLNLATSDVRLEPNEDYFGCACWQEAASLLPRKQAKQLPSRQF